MHVLPVKSVVVSELYDIKVMLRADSLHSKKASQSLAAHGHGRPTIECFTPNHSTENPSLHMLHSNC